MIGPARGSPSRAAASGASPPPSSRAGTCSSPPGRPPTSRPWLMGKVKFGAVVLDALMWEVGASDDRRVIIRLKDSSPELPLAHTHKHNDMLALKLDGE